MACIRSIGDLQFALAAVASKRREGSDCGARNTTKIMLQVAKKG